MAKHGTRPTWKGQLCVSLVHVPVALYTTGQPAERIRFHKYHATCGSRVKHKSWCETCDRAVSGESVRGYEYTKDKHVVVSDEALATCKTSQSHRLDLKTVSADPLDPASVDGTYFLVPQPGGETAFATLREAIERMNVTAIGTMVLSDRPQLVALTPRDAGFVVYALRAFSRVRALATLSPAHTAVNPKEVKLATTLLKGLQGSFVYDARITDEYVEKVRAMLAAQIKAKETGKPVPVPNEVMPRAQVHRSLGDALSASLKAAMRPKAKTVQRRRAK